MQGRVADSADRSPLAGVNLILTLLSDTTRMAYTTSGPDGAFRFNGLDQGHYRLRGSFVGFDRIQRTVNLARPVTDLELLLMHRRVETIEGVEVTGVMPRAVQKGDTTEFNAAAFKTLPEATAEDLITKMPGVTVEQGTVRAQGEDVKKVLVDGKPFFGDDPTLALRTLPAEVIDKIQFFDKMSEQAEFTGFDDGQSVRAINIITRMDRRTGQFGKTYAGYGTDQRYLAGGNISFFTKKRRISLIGLTNNVNRQNFSTQDLLGVAGTGGMRRFGPGGAGRMGGSRLGSPQGGGPPIGGGSIGDFMTGQQNGNTTTHAFGLNYSGNWGEKIRVDGSYFFNATENETEQSLTREYYSGSEAGQYYDEANRSDADNFNHRFNLRLDYTIDSMNSILLMPRLSLQDNRTRSLVSGTTTAGPQVISSTMNDNGSDLSGIDFSNDILYRHRFRKEGRTVSVNLGTRLNDREGESTLCSTTSYDTGQGGLSDTIDQHTGLSTTGRTLSGRVIYTEPVGTKGQLQLSYSPSHTFSDADRKTYHPDPVSGEYVILDTALSNLYTTTYLTHRAGAGYRYRNEKSNLMINLDYQQADLSGDEEFPVTETTERRFRDLLPSVMFRHKFSNQSNLRLFYRTSTQPPSIDQLQQVVDNANPLLLSTGNPELRQEYRHMAVARFSQANTEEGNSFFVFLFGSLTGDAIGTATWYDYSDTLTIGGIILPPGTQLSRPVNLDGSRNIRSFITFGFPVKKIQCNLNLNTGVSYTRTPGLINDRQNISGTFTVSQGFVLSSNISDKVDFRLSYTGNINFVDNTIRKDMNSDYYNHNAGFRIDWITWRNLVLQTDITHSLYAGMSEGYNEDFLLWNAGIGKKVFANQRGEIRLSVFDILDRNRTISRTVTGFYVEDSRTELLRRYLMLTFTYYVRHFGTAPVMPARREWQRF